MGEIRICGVEHLRGSSRDRKWNKLKLKWKLQRGLPGVMADALHQAFLESFANWQAVCGLQFEPTTSGRADILIDTGRIDGASGTLAWSELPPSNPVHQKYDTSESWTTKGGRGQLIDLVAVATHEIGHGIGLFHDERVPRGQKALMAPFYDPSIRTPQPRDVERVQKLYGPPVAIPDQPSSPTEGIVLVVKPGVSVEVPGKGVIQL